jgi:hypothetical protein
MIRPERLQGKLLILSMVILILDNKLPFYSLAFCGAVATGLNGATLLFLHGEWCFLFIALLLLISL